VIQRFITAARGFNKNLKLLFDDRLAYIFLEGYWAQRSIIALLRGGNVRRN
jgi:hypothetical protein